MTDTINWIAVVNGLSGSLAIFFWHGDYDLWPEKYRWEPFEGYLSRLYT